ncbi:MAG: nucleotidyltransferase domain-containing protein [Promethearchaeota archaeon]|nr:MAG: nucleotidyltransferase domain-containing protein [Candidatus Lokiarchaeota archaeon]
MALKTDLKSVLEIKDQIKEDFKFIKKNPKILGVILYGSVINGTYHHQSDIDVCIVTTYEKLIDAYNYIIENLRKNLHEYDIRFFKELPLFIQGEIIENGIPVISNNIYKLYEYLFPFRKRFEDWKLKLKLLHVASY